MANKKSDPVPPEEIEITSQGTESAEAEATAPVEQDAQTKTATEQEAEEQPEGVMAADKDFEENVPCAAFPWKEVVKWSIVVTVVALVLYLIFRRDD
ncbi:MAG TPA: hypothetical protein P5179_00370 [Candidatus Latescibacteria bacterium]|jgi:hypothetical protein|nr:hypothetical protein [Candidatus Latescibacterota bacterium]HQE61332.1 hypothetical protein [Candidatus Latescibacterota bacterium]HQK21733.1 hypothetical protein [Candidatus Latescibacterota bacterium]HRS93706.1 hypothetical protein [Candidatus Latescibacterota bacterium]